MNFRANRHKIFVGVIVVALLACGAIRGEAQTPPAAPAVAPVAAAQSPPASPAAGGAAAPAQTKPPGTPASSPPADAADPMADAQLRVSIQESYEFRTKLRPPEIMPQEFGTVFFTLWQHALLQEAKRGYMTRKPTASELANSGPAVPGERPHSIREISLGGIVYRQPKDWTIWLNGQRVTPDALPEQVLDLKVAEDHIDLKWFDTFSNLIYPIRLRSHQRFNLDARIFLPGVGTGTQ